MNNINYNSNGSFTYTDEYGDLRSGWKNKDGSFCYYDSNGCFQKGVSFKDGSFKCENGTSGYTRYKNNNSSSSYNKYSNNYNKYSNSSTSPSSTYSSPGYSNNYSTSGNYSRPSGGYSSYSRYKPSKLSRIWHFIKVIFYSIPFLLFKDAIGTIAIWLFLNISGILEVDFGAFMIGSAVVHYIKNFIVLHLSDL